MKLLLLVVGLASAGYFFYLVLRWMERRGWVNLRSTGGAAAGATAFRELLDPPARHVRQVKEQHREPGDPGGPDLTPPPRR